MKVGSQSLWTLLILGLLCFFTGCGGGTVGTDDGATLRVSGTVVDSRGELISDALVIVESTGDSSRSDQQGRFEITTAKITESRIRVDAIIDGSELSITSEPITFNTLLNTQSFAITISVDAATVTVEDFDIDQTPPPATPTPQSSVPDRVPDSPPLLGNSTIRAIVRDQFGQALSGVSVTVEGERTAVTSKDDGTLVLQFSSRRTRLSLLLQYKGQRARISLTGLPGTPVVIRLGIAIKTIDPEQVDAQITKELDVDFDFQVRTVKSSG